MMNSIQMESIKYSNAKAKALKENSRHYLGDEFRELIAAKSLKIFRNGLKPTSKTQSFTLMLSDF